MSDANANAWYARLIGECLLQHDISDVVLCPGNRNSPLLFALKKIFKQRAHIHIDERSAAFMALGMAKQRKQAVVVCMTSGTAVANALPALCEAHASHIPLIILSADRPDYLHDCGAPQCMRQQHIFKPFVADSIHLACSSITEQHVQLALLQLSNALTHCAQRNPAPIHVNITFDDPLPPTIDQNWTSPVDPKIEIFDKQFTFPSTCLPDSLSTLSDHGGRGLIVCGADAPISKENLIVMARITGYPVLADACSGMRQTDIPQLITQADLFCQFQGKELQTDILIRVGMAPLSRSVYEYCGRQQCPVIRIDNREIKKDFLHQHFVSLIQPDSACLTALAQACTPAPSDWQDEWLYANNKIEASLQTFIANNIWGECLAAALVCRQTHFQQLQCANSMAVRHANIFCSASDNNICAYRGVNGIDGTLATFIGSHYTQTQPGILLCGDIAFFHDLPALHAAQQIQHSACICVLNNHGGHIFDLLPAADCDQYQELMVTPQAAHIADIAAAFDLPYTAVNDGDALLSTLAAHAQIQQCSIVEILVPENSLSLQWAEIKNLASA